jgi:hypothetical protein
METIFVQIASYRDTELLPTIKDCIAKATYPDRLRFGICWQHAPEDQWDNLDEFKSDTRFRIMDVPWQQSKGLGWARSHTQKLWRGETYTLQLDSHHRFIQGWDTELINMMAMTGSPKPILTSYAAPYTPGEPMDNPVPYKMVGTTFSSYGTILFYPHVIPNPETLTKPIPARFVSGHFFFTLGIHCQEYKYDPEIYFAGDEISLSIRSFTMGYDLFHPHKHVVWHQYIRAQSKKHWDDFNSNSKQNGTTADAWHELDDVSKKRLRQMLREEDNHVNLGEYTLGRVRSHADYEKYAGISFKHRKLHPTTMRGETPPVGLASSEWLMGSQTYSLQLAISRTWASSSVLCIYDENNVELYKNTITPHQAITQVDFTCSSIPYKWTYDGHTIILGKTEDAFEPVYVQSIPLSETKPMSIIQDTVPVQDMVPVQQSSLQDTVLVQDMVPVQPMSLVQNTYPVQQAMSSVHAMSLVQNTYPVQQAMSSVHAMSPVQSVFSSIRQPMTNDMSNLSFYSSQKPIRNKVSISMINPWFR